MSRFLRLFNVIIVSIACAFGVFTNAAIAVTDCTVNPVLIRLDPNDVANAIVSSYDEKCVASSLVPVAEYDGGNLPNIKDSCNWVEQPLCTFLGYFLYGYDNNLSPMVFDQNLYPVDDPSLWESLCTAYSGKKLTLKAKWDCPCTLATFNYAGGNITGTQESVYTQLYDGSGLYSKRGVYEDDQCSIEYDVNASSPHLKVPSRANRTFTGYSAPTKGLVGGSVNDGTASYSVYSTAVFDDGGVVLYNSVDSGTTQYEYDPVMVQTPITAKWRMPYTLDIVAAGDVSLVGCESYEFNNLYVLDGGELPFGLFAISGGEGAKCNVCGDDKAPTGWNLFVVDSDQNNDDDPVATDLPTSGFNIETVLSQYYYDSNHTIDLVNKVLIKPTGCRTACYLVTFNNDGKSVTNTNTKLFRKPIEAGSQTPAVWYSDEYCTTTAVTTPAISMPTTTGYSFGGYYATGNRQIFTNQLDQGFLVESTGNTSWSVTEDTELHANWTPIVYIVTLSADGGSGGIEAIYEKYETGWSTSQNGSFGSVNLSGNQLPTRTGYTFDGYADAQSNGSPVGSYVSDTWSAPLPDTVAADTTWYAQWTPNIYTVTLNANDGTAGSVTTIYEKYDTGWSTSSSGSSFNMNFTLSGNQLPTRTGYTFAGYADAASNGGPVGTLSNGTWTAPTGANAVSSDTTLYAQWTPNTYNINYTWNGGTASSSAVPSGYTQLEYITSTGTQYIDTGFKGNLNTKAEIVFKFNEYSTSGGVIFGARTNSSNRAFIVGSSDGKISQSSTLFGQFDTVSPTSILTLPNIDLEKHVVQLSADGLYIDGTKYRSYTNPTTFETPATITLFARYSGGSLAKGEITVYSWKLWDGDTLVQYLVPAKNSSNVVGMYDLVSRTFFENAGTGDFTDGNPVATPYPSSYTYGVGTTVYGVPTRVGSSFEGWCSDVALTNCASPYEITTTDTGDKPLYAKWSCRAGYHLDASTNSCVGNTISVTYNNGGHGTTPQATSCMYGGTLMLPTALTTTGYTFNKWSVAGNTFNPHVSINCDYDSLGVYETPNGTSVTITATWTPTCNAITLNPNTGSAGTFAILYKKSGAPAVWYTDSACTNTFNYQTTSIVPSKSGGYTFRGFYLNQADADTISETQTDGAARHIKEDGQPTVTGNAWNVTGAETLYAGWAQDCNDPIANGSCTLNVGQNTTYTTSCDTGYVCVSGDGTYNPVCVNGTNNIVYTYNGGTVGSTDLPAGYTQLEYVTADGNQYFDTGILIEKSYEIRSRFTPTVGSKFLYGVRNATSNDTASITGYMSGNWRFGSKAISKTLSLNRVHTVIQNVSGLTVDGTTTTYPAQSADFTTPDTLLFGTARNYDGISPSRFVGNIYGFRIIDENQKDIMNLIPAKNSSNVSGFYDLVSGNFFTSITGTDFDAGPAVTTAYPTTYNVGVGVDVYGVPKRAGSVFVGWCRDSALSTGCAMAPHEVTTTDTGLVYLYAKWTCKPGYTASGNSCVGNTYTVTLSKNHSDASGYIDPTPTIYEKYGTGWSKLQNSQFRPSFTLSEDSLPTRTGYSFDGYYDTAAATGGNEFGTFTINVGGNGIFDEVTWTAPSATTVTENTTVYARWTPITYNITYEWNGGTSNSTSLPNGYTQLEYIASDGTPFINTGIMGLNKRVVVDAQYTGTDTALKILAGYDMNYTGTFVAVRSGKWALNSSYITSVSASDRTTVSVVFDRNANNYTHAILTANGESVEYTRSNTREDAPIVLFNGGYTVVNTTYGFVGRIYHVAIYDKDTGKLLFNGVPALNSLNVPGIYDLVSRRFLTNDADSGAFTAGNPVTTPYPNQYTYGVGATIYGVPTRTNSVFEAWCADSSLSINCVLPHEITTTDYGDKTLYAKWSCVSGYHLDSNGSCVGNTISVTYNNGGHGTAPSSPAICTYGGTLTLPAAITTTGYTFDQWSVAGHTFNDGSTITCNYNNLGVYETPNETSVTITATWTPTCNAIRLGPNGGIAGTVAMLYKKSGEPATWYDDGKCTTLAEFGLNIIPRRSDWTFRGFYSNQVADVTSSSLGSNFSQRIIDDQGQPTVAGNAWDVTVAETLYAGWAHDCDPTHATCNLSVSGENVVYTTSCNTGYVYTSGQSAYNPVCEGRVYTITLNKNHNDATNWTHSQSVVYEKYGTMWFVTPDAVSIDDPNPNSPVEVTAFTGTRLPTRAGYTFMGYFDAPTGGNPVGTYSNGTWTLPPNTTYLSNATLYAHWTANAYDISYEWNGATANSSAVPSGYTQVEYLVSDGNQKIDTGIYGIGKRVVIDAQYTGESSNTVKFLAGYYSGEYIGTFAGVYSNKWGLSSGYKLTNSSATNRTRLTLSFDTNSSSEYHNRAVLAANGETTTVTRANVLNNGTIWLLNAGTNANRGFLGQVYHVLIYDDATGAVMFNGIPARSNSNNELGLYDTVSGTFFTATGSTALSAGLDVLSTPYPTSYTAGVGTMVYGVPARTGSVFVGWCRNSNLTTGCASPHEITTTDYGNKPLYAKWDCAMGYTKNDQTGLCEVSPAFTVTVKVPTNTTFKFSMAAKGNFTIDWGDASAVQVVNSPDVTKTEYTHTYTFSGSGTQTFDIKINGAAAGYSNSSINAAISFFNATVDEDDNIVENGDGTEVYIDHVAGSLGKIFRAMDDSRANNMTPRFYQTFRNAKNMTQTMASLSNLFSGVNGTTGVSMFQETFRGCTHLTGAIPADLFGRVENGEYSGIDGAVQIQMFAGTFFGCSGLTGSIPENLFGRGVNGVYHGIDGGASNFAFSTTFYGCSGLTGSIPANLFGRVVNGVYHGIDGAPGRQIFYNTFYDCSGLTGSIPETLFGRYVGGVYYGLKGTPSNVSGFSGTFKNCSSLTGSIPAGLFAGISGDLSSNTNVFYGTFSGCSGLTGSIPADLFGRVVNGEYVGIDGAPAYGMFRETFRGCSGLTGAIPETLFGRVVNGVYHGLNGVPAVNMFYGTFWGCSGLTGSIPGNLFNRVVQVNGVDTFYGISGEPRSGVYRDLFNGCSGLTGTIPTTLFGRTVNGTYYGLIGDPKDNIFNRTFYGCSGLTGEIPSYLLGHFDGTVKAGTFSQTFRGCSGLTGTIPGNLFGGLDLEGPIQTFSFYATFYGCSGLTGYVPVNLFGQVTRPVEDPESMMSSVFYSSGLATSCPCGTTRVTTSPFTDKWNGKVSCTPGLSAGQHWYNGQCTTMCSNAAIDELHVGALNAFPVLTDKLTTPSINIKLGNKQCYVPLATGNGGTNSLNMSYGGNVYHADRPDDVQPAGFAQRD